MPGSPPHAGPFVYQLRVVLRGVSPLIWRRLLVRSDSSIAELHTTLQLVLGWSDEHLNRFVVHGREYGVWRSEEHTSELQSRLHLVCRLLLEKKNIICAPFLL